MNNLQGYTQFNEGIRKWASKKFNPGDYGSTMSDILKNNIKPHFKIKYLTAGYTRGESQELGYIYKDGNYDVEVFGGGGEYNNPPRMYLNGEPITTKINKKIILDYYNFFDKMYNRMFAPEALDSKSDDFYHGGLS